jgi:hypothetical protein
MYIQYQRHFRCQEIKIYRSPAHHYHYKPTMMKTAAVILSVCAVSASAFAPAPQQQQRVAALNAERRDILGLAGGFLLAGITNPALQTFKSKKKGGASYIPGKGLRQHDDQLVAGITNPALQTFKSKKKGGASYIPGKGLRQQSDDMMA